MNTLYISKKGSRQGAPAATPIGGRLLLAEATYERRLSSAAKFSGVIPQPSSSVPGGGAAGAGTGTSTAAGPGGPEEGQARDGNGFAWRTDRMRLLSSEHFWLPSRSRFRRTCAVARFRAPRHTLGILSAHFDHEGGDEPGAGSDARPSRSGGCGMSLSEHSISKRWRGYASPARPYSRSVPVENDDEHMISRTRPPVRKKELRTLL